MPDLSVFARCLYRAACIEGDLAGCLSFATSLLKDAGKIEEKLMVILGDRIEECSVDSVICKLVSFLRGRGMIRFLPEILRQFMVIAEREKSKDQTSVVLAKAGDLEKYRKTIERFLGSELDSNYKKAIPIKVEPGIISGFKLVKGFVMLDCSARSVLTQVASKISANLSKGTSQPSRQTVSKGQFN